MGKKGAIVLVALLIASPAFADGAIEHFGSAGVTIVIVLFFGAVCPVIFALMASLRFGLKRPLLSVGAYIFGGLALLYQTSNYLVAYNIHSLNLQIWKDVGMKGDPGFVELSKRTLEFHAYWFYAGLLIMVIYTVLDNLSHRNKKYKRIGSYRIFRACF